MSSETGVMTIVEFLTARLDEDEAIAAQAQYESCWIDYGDATVEFIDRFRDRMLADIAAKRRIIAWCSEREQIYVGTLAGNPDAPRPQDFVPGDFAHREDAVVLRFLALPYADHPDYRLEWKP